MTIVLILVRSNCRNAVVALYLKLCRKFIDTTKERSVELFNGYRQWDQRFSVMGNFVTWYG